MSKDYPYPLRALIQKYSEKILYRIHYIVDWRTIASCRGDQEYIDKETEYRIKENLAHEIIKQKVVVYQDQSLPEGRKYYASIVAMDRGELELLLYEAYREGISAVAREPLKLEKE